jgi:hypothetical protein
VSRRPGGSGLIPPRDQLEWFIEKVQELNRSALIRKGFKSGFTLRWRQASGLNIDFRQPSDEDLRGFLITFRQFWMNDEPIQMRKIYNLLQQVVTDAELKQNLVEARTEWTQTLSQGPIKLKLDSKVLSPDDVADLWINGWYFHTTIDKRKELEDLAMQHVFNRHAFLFFLTDAARIVLYTGDVALFCVRQGLIDYNAVRR